MSVCSFDQSSTIGSHVPDSEVNPCLEVSAMFSDLLEFPVLASWLVLASVALETASEEEFQSVTRLEMPVSGLLAIRSLSSLSLFQSAGYCLGCSLETSAAKRLPQQYSAPESQGPLHDSCFEQPPS